MEFKVGDRKIVDTRRYGLFGKNVMIVTLDAFGKKNLMLKHNERTRAFILYLIGEINKEFKKETQLIDCQSYKVLDNYLNLMSIQIDLLSNECSDKWSMEIVKFVQSMSNSVKPKRVSKKKDRQALDEAVMIEEGMKIKRVKKR